MRFIARSVHGCVCVCLFVKVGVHGCTPPCRCVHRVKQSWGIASDNDTEKPSLPHPAPIHFPPLLLLLLRMRGMHMQEQHTRIDAQTDTRALMPVNITACPAGLGMAHKHGSIRGMLGSTLVDASS